jgi:hypothetical protein
MLHLKSRRSRTGQIFRNRGAQSFAFLFWFGLAGFSCGLVSGEPSLVTRETSLGKVLPTAIRETIICSPDQKHIAYVALRSARSVALLDGKPGKDYDRIMGLAFSPAPSGQAPHLGYAARRAENGRA